MSFDRHDKQWKCGKAGAVNLQLLSSIVRDIQEPCLHQSPSQGSKMLKPEKWRATFDSDGKVLDFQKALKLIFLGGVDPSIRAEVWEFLLGCYALSSTAEYRRQLRMARRERYEDLIRQCQTMHPSIGTGSLAYAVGSKVMDMRLPSKDNGKREAEAESESSHDISDKVETYHNQCTYGSYTCQRESSSNSTDLVSVRETTDTAAYDSSYPMPSSGHYNCFSPKSRREQNGSEYLSKICFDFPPLPVTNLFERSDSDGEECGVHNNRVSTEHRLSLSAENMHGFQINNNVDLIMESNSSPSNAVSHASNSKVEMHNSDIQGQVVQAPNVEYKTEIVNRLRISDVPQTAMVDATASQRGSNNEDRVSEWLWTLHQIVVDVVRTDSHLEFYENVKNVARMSDILAVYAWVDPATGYCQGMSDLLSPFVVLYEDNADAFWCFEMLLRRMRENFQMEGPTGVMKQLQALWCILEATDREMFVHLSLIGAESLHFAFRMLLVLFRRELSFNEVLCMWEMMWAADFDESVARELEENCLESLVVKLPRNSGAETGEETAGNGNGNSKGGSRSKHGNVQHSMSDNFEMKSASSRPPFCGLTRSFWSRNDRMHHMSTLVTSTRNGDDELAVYCVAAILIINRQKIIKEAHSIDDLIKCWEMAPRAIDVGWMYCTKINNNRLQTKCNFCDACHYGGGVTRHKQHLAGGYANVQKCTKCPLEISRKMQEHLARSRAKGNQREDDDERLTEELMEDIDEYRGSDVGPDDEDAEMVAAMRASREEARAHEWEMRHGMRRSQSYRPGEGSGSGTPSRRKEKSERVEAFCRSASVKEMFDMFKDSGKGKMKSTDKGKKKKSPDIRDMADPAAYRPRDASQRRIEESLKSHSLRARMGRAISRWFHSALIPAHKAKDPHFKAMVREIQRCGPNVTPPTPYEISGTYLDEVVVEVKEYIERFKEKWPEYGVTIMCDGWSGPTRLSIINFLVFCDGRTIFHKSINASAEIKDAAYLYRLMDEVVEEIGEENVVQIVTDNAANFKKAGLSLMQKRQHIYWTPCAAHCIDLIFKDIGEIKKIQDLVSDARRITNFIYNHSWVLALMRSHTLGDLVRPASTRFATNYVALSSLLERMDGLVQMFTSQDWFCSTYASSEPGRYVQDLVTSTRFWAKIRRVNGLMQPLFSILREVDGDKDQTMGILMDRMLRAMLTVVQLNTSESQKVAKIIDSRLGGMLLQDGSQHGGGMEFTCEQGFTHATQDPDHGARTYSRKGKRSHQLDPDGSDVIMMDSMGFSSDVAASSSHGQHAPSPQFQHGSDSSSTYGMGSGFGPYGPQLDSGPVISTPDQYDRFYQEWENKYHQYFDWSSYCSYVRDVHKVVLVRPLAEGMSTSEMQPPRSSFWM